MFTDMVGYSGLIQKNEALGLELLAEHRVIVRELLAKYSGREVDTAGDAFFVEFRSALEATQCAIDIQKALHDRNTTVPADRRIVLRIGLHLGDVVHVGDQVQGDGVNIAARMEPLARPGSICISEDVARQVHNKIDVPIVGLGRRQLKNIRLPMRAYRIVLPWEEDSGHVRLPGDFDSSTETRAKWRTSRIGRYAMAILVTLAVGWFVTRSLHILERSPDAVSSPSLVAVLPFTVQGGSEYAYLGKGMVDLLSTKLDGAGSLRTVDPRAVHGIVTQMPGEDIDPAAGREIARRLGAGAFVLGNIVEIGGRLRIDATVYRGEGTDPTDQGTVEGAATDVFDLLDRLATQLLVMDRDGPGAPLERLAAMTTSNLDALKHYLHGVNAFRTGRFQVAADELRMAVAEDSTFALAWYQLSATAEWLFDPVLAWDAIRRASRHADRLSERGRRLVEALEATKSGRNDEALQRYRSILTSYPDDVEAWYQLGELIFHAGPMIGVPPEESFEAWEQLLFYEPDQITALIHMARLWLHAGDMGKVDSVAQVIFALEPDAERNAELRAHIAFNRKGREAVGDVLSDLDGVGDDMLLEVVWSLAVFRDDPWPAMTTASLLTTPTRANETRALGHLLRGYFLAGGGRFVEADREFDRADELGHPAVPEHRAALVILPFRPMSRERLLEVQSDLEQWDAAAVPESSRKSSWYTAHDGIHEELKQYLIGIIRALVGEHNRALEAASSLEMMDAPERAGSLPSDLALGIRAQVALERKEPEDAERLLVQTRGQASYHYVVNSVFFALSRERFLLATLLEDQGDLEAAIQAMGFFRRQSMFDWIYAAQSHLGRASAYEKMGDHSREAEHLRRFIALWADCDDGLQPVVDEARQRLSNLEG